MQKIILPHFEIKDLDQICIEEVLDKNLISKVINKSGMEAICHVDKLGHLTGITCDSDLRKSPGELINRNPQKIYQNSTRIGLIRDYIPVVDKNNKLISVLFRPKDQVLRFAEAPKSITIVGIGYVGLTLAIAFAIKGVKVYCIDKNTELIDLLKKGKLPFYETGLEEALSVAFKNLIFESTFSKINTSEIILTVGTPLNNNNEVNLSYLYDAIDQIVEASDTSNLKNLILRSTVPVGTCDKVESMIFQKYNRNINCIMCPERTIEGKAIEELATNPQIIGTYSLKAASICYKLFNLLTDTIHISNNPKFAELAKLGDNTYRDIKFAYSNFLGITAQKLNLVGSDLIKTMNQDYARNDLSTPSPGVGGPCLSKDAYIFKNGLDKLGIKDSSFILSGRSQDDIVISYIANVIKDHCLYLNNNKVSIAGLSFKGFPETSDVRDSSSLKLINKLTKYYNIHVFDPLAIDNSEKINYKRENFNDFTLKSSVLIIMTNHPSFKSSDWNTALMNLEKQALVIDGWNILERYNVALEYDLIYRQF